MTAPVYYAAVVLLPHIKLDYFREHLGNSEYNEACTFVQKLWQDEYKGQESIFHEPPNHQPTTSSLLADYMRPRGLAIPQIQDEYERYIQAPIDHNAEGNHLSWWQQHQSSYPQLSIMARDIFAIPGMSAEVERLFSGTKLMLPPSRNCLKDSSIESAVCVSSWVKGGLILGEYFGSLPAGLRAKEGYIEWKDIM